MKLNVIERCRIVHEALQPGGDFPHHIAGLAKYLEVSHNLVYKMSVIHLKMIEQLKNWMKNTPYDVDKAYQMVAKLTPEDQLQFVNLTLEDKIKFLQEFRTAVKETTNKHKPVEPKTEVKEA